MTPDEAPVGTVVQIGANGSFAQRDVDGHWRYLQPTGARVAYDDLHKTARSIYIPLTLTLTQEAHQS